jgi:energy-coupling factor transporter transmembrane protein EcfT
MSFWKARDPRAKVFLAVVVSFAVAVAPGSRVLVLFPAVLLLLLTAGLDRDRLVNVFRATVVLWILSFVANAFLIPGTKVGPGFLGWARPTEEGLWAGFGHGGRLGVLTALSTWAATTTGALDLAGSLEWSVRRFPGLRKAAHRALLPVVLSLRMIPLFSAEAQRLMDVDRLRKGPRRGLGGVRRLARLTPVWVVTVVERAEALALALTLRGYRPEGERSFAREFRFGIWDLGLVVAAVAAVVYLERA